MSTKDQPATFQLDDTDVPALRNAISHIVRAGYSETRVRERLGLSDIADIKWRAIPIYRKEQLTVRDALDSAIDLFLLQGAISKDELNQLFDMVDQDFLVRVGLLLFDERGYVRSRASLFPVGGFLIFSDHTWPKLPHPGFRIIPYDQVMFVGADSRWLSRATVRRAVASTLDLCTGSGIHALLAAAHSQRVLAVDINPRAADCTRFNAQASGATNVEIAVGDLFDPVRGERFDLITANPPFVPSPVNSLGFRDGGSSGEDVQRRIVEGLPLHLAPGGIAQIVTELGERDDELISDRLRKWLGDAPMDILILRLREHSAANYAIGHAQGDYDFGEFLDSVDDWAENLRTQGYSRIVSVLLAFQWSDPACGPSWTRIEETTPPIREAGSEVESLIYAERMARNPGLFSMLVQSRICRAGTVGLMESRMLGSGIRTNTQAQLLGKSLSIFHWLDPIERDILELMDEPLGMSELILHASEIKIDGESVFKAVASLIRRGLVNIN